jgi:hypothetical protein
MPKLTKPDPQAPASRTHIESRPTGDRDHLILVMADELQATYRMLAEARETIGVLTERIDWYKAVVIDEVKGVTRDQLWPDGKRPGSREPGTGRLRPARITDRPALALVTRGG